MSCDCKYIDHLGDVEAELERRAGVIEAQFDSVCSNGHTARDQYGRIQQKGETMEHCLDCDSQHEGIRIKTDFLRELIAACATASQRGLKRDAKRAEGCAEDLCALYRQNCPEGFAVWLNNQQFENTGLDSYARRRNDA